MNKPLKITEVVLRDGHQSLFATRMRIDDMLPIAEKLDQIGYWSIETWGGATFDSCIRYLGEDPWERIRLLKQAMPNTPQQMLLRSQNILGYRHYADDVVDKFVERSATNGVDIFRVFDAMNDVRNMQRALKAVIDNERHAQGTLSYTISPVDNIDHWVDMARKIEDMGAHSLCIKDMAGLLKPYVGFELVTRLKKAVDIPVQLHAHATTGLSTATIVKCVEAGIDAVDTSISSMSMTYGHSPTESIVAIMQDCERDTGLDIDELENIAAYFREARKKYTGFEGSLKGVDSRILIAQVPGGMLTNMESQLKDQNASDKFDEVLDEIPKVRKDLGYIPLVTPTSQIVGTQAVLNVLNKERYKTITKETIGVLKGEYGATSAPVNADLQARVLEGEEPINCRPADLLEPEMDKFNDELSELAASKSIKLRDGEKKVDDVLIYALFSQIGLRYLENRNNPDAFEPHPKMQAAGIVTDDTGNEIYTVEVEGQKYTVKVNNGGDISSIAPTAGVTTSSVPESSVSGGEPIDAPLAGNVLKIEVRVGQRVSSGDTLIILEAMKMETSISAPQDGTITSVEVHEGSSVAVGDTLLTLN